MKAYMWVAAPTMLVSGIFSPPAGAASGHGTAVLPTALRPVLYRALAKDAAATYQINEHGCAALPKQTLKACFDGCGAHFTGAMPLALRLDAYGRGNRLTAVQALKPETRGNEVSYRHGALTEWWRVLPVGFEQGFTIAKRPAGHGELTLALVASRQDAGAPDVKQGNNTLAWGALRYGELVVTGANGRVVPANLKTKGDHILIAVNDARATYPLTVDPLVWLEQKVTASDGAEFDNFGLSVAVSGTTAVVGADGVSVNGNGAQGAAYVFANSSGTWIQMQKLTASDGAPGDSFGAALALDDQTGLVGATGADVNGNSSQGAAFVFTESGGTWTQTQKLTSNDGAQFDDFGQSVILDGSTALVGAIGADANGNNGPGAAYVFSESGGTWTQTQKLAASDGAAGDEFGFSAVLDGSIAFVGAPFADPNGNSAQGAAYVFSESGDTWNETQKLTVSDGAAGDEFGFSVALDGPTALVGALDASVNGNFAQGAAYVFDESNGTWTQTQKLIASDGTAGDLFGASIALTGTTGLVGAFGADVNGDAFRGAAYFFGQSDLDLDLSAPQVIDDGDTYTSQAIATNNATATSPAVTVTVAVPAAASLIGAGASQGDCAVDAQLVSCDLGEITGNAGTATVNVVLKTTGAIGTSIENTAKIANATPPLAASAATAIVSGVTCPDGYSKFEGNLAAGRFARTPSYRAPEGEESAILTAPTGFRLYVRVRVNPRTWTTYLVTGHEIHRDGPDGTYTWIAQAGDGGGFYTLCIQHP